MGVEDIFRAYDIRGVYGTELTAEFAARVGQVFGSYLGGDRTVAVARDVRTSSPTVSSALVAGIAASGCRVTDAGVLPIPLANFATWRGGFQNGAYITASHNPPEYNGIRFRHPDGTGFTTENVAIKEAFLAGKLRQAPWDQVHPVRRLDEADVLRDYIGFHQERISIPRRLRVAVDPGNGAAGLVVRELFAAFGIEIEGVHMEIDGRFPNRDPEPRAGNLLALSKRVLERVCDFGVAYDGDADRVIVVDELGKPLQVEKLGVILAKQAVARKKGPVIVNAPCSMIVEDALADTGVPVIRSRVGDVFVCEALKQHHAIFAMEISAHYFIADDYPFDDPFLATLRLAEIMARSHLPLSNIVGEIPTLPVLEKNFACPDRVKWDVVRRITESARARGEKVDLIDGVKVVRPNGWALVRCSNTQPMVRLFAEGRTPDDLAALATEFEAELRGAMKAAGA